MTSVVRSKRTLSPVLVATALLALCLVFLMFGLSGCGKNDESVTPTTPPYTGKPLPEACADSELLTANFGWVTAKPTFGYKFEFGFAGQAPFEIQSVEANVNSYTFEKARRGRSYYFSVTREGSTGESETRTMTASVPKCADRAKYKAKHPEYEEPLVSVTSF